MLKTSSITQTDENLSFLLIAEDAERGGSGGDCKDKTVKKLLCSNNLNKAMSYLTPNAKKVFI